MSWRPDAHDPLHLRGRRNRFRYAVSVLAVGSAALTLSYNCVQVKFGEQRRETILTQEYHTPDGGVLRADEVLSVMVFLTATSGTWATPAGVTSARVDCIGGGAAGIGGDGASILAAGSGGGAWARGAAVPVAGSMNYAVGAGGAATAASSGTRNHGNSTWFGGTNYSNSLVGAPGGTAGDPASGFGGAGGAAASCRGGAVGSTLNPGTTYARSGGSGTPTTFNVSGSGGAGGPNGNGNPGQAYASIGAPGGSGDAGFGGAGGGPGGSGAPTTGGNGAEYDATHGSGGGAGGTVSPAFAKGGGFYGGAGGSDVAAVGGGPGAQGLIVVVYTLPTAQVPFRRTTRFFTRRF